MRVVLLAVEYDCSDDEKRERFMQDFCSRVLLTYRKGITIPLKLVGGTEINSDSGWGCMLRVTQMMLAQSFVSLVLGREWRYNEERDLADGSTYLDIMSCMLDSPGAPLSLHSLVAAGQHLLGKEPSAWFGPTSAARAAGHIFNSVAAESKDGAPRLPDQLQKVRCAVFEDGTIYRAAVIELFEAGCDAVVILVCRRLGLDSFNLAEYRAGVEACFDLPEFQGLASGNSGSSAHFFVGTHDDCLIYMDPHRTQPSLETVDDVRGSLKDSVRPDRALALRWARLNPSVCLGFLVRSLSEFTELCSKLCDKPRIDVFEVLEKQPSYADRPETEETEGEMVLLD